MLNKQFILDTLGSSSFERLLTLESIKSSIFIYIKPFVASIGTMLNMVVFLLSIAIYTKTKKKNHKPAFLYIGVLAFFDMVMGATSITDFENDATHNILVKLNCRPYFK